MADTTKETQDQVTNLRARLARLEYAARYFSAPWVDARAYSTLQDAVDALPSTGGTVDARGLTGTRTISSTVSFGSATRPVTLIMDPKTTYQPSAADVDMFLVGPNGQLRGATIDVTNVTYTGAAVTVQGVMGDNTMTSIENVRLTGGTTGTALLYSTASGADQIAFVSASNIRIYGFEYGILIDSDVNWINSNTFKDIVLNKCVYGLSMSATADIYANLFDNVQYQAGTNTSKAIVVDGIANQFTNTIVWDVTSPDTGIEFLSSSERNYVFGRIDGVVTDSGDQNTLINLRGTAGDVRWEIGADFGVRVTHSGGKGVSLLNKGTAVQWSMEEDSGLLYFALSGAGIPVRMSGAQLQLPIEGSSGGLLIGGDAQWYRSAANTLRTPDSVVVDNDLTVGDDFAVTGLTSLGPGTELTIAGGAITVTGSFHIVDTESDAASDDLSTISGGSTGTLLVLQTANAGRDVTVKDGTGLRLAGDCLLSNPDDSITLIKDARGVWVELSRSDNA